ncbi:MAG: ferredoxin [Pseudomonadota bacterium]
MTLPPLLEKALARRGLRTSGGFHPSAEDALPDDIASVVLLSPGEGFWPIFAASHEYQGGKPDPMDRWSARIITDLAKMVGGAAYFPFGAPPAPFFSWAQRSGQAWPSPVHLLVGANMGLNLSFRGALGLRETLHFEDRETPCKTCARPCLSACPIAALTDEGYDVEKCRAHLRAEPNGPCRRQGCLVRRSCPASTLQSPAQAQFHMKAFAP